MKRKKTTNLHFWWFKPQFWELKIFTKSLWKCSWILTNSLAKKWWLKMWSGITWLQKLVKSIWKFTYWRKIQHLKFWKIYQLFFLSQHHEILSIIKVRQGSFALVLQAKVLFVCFKVQSKCIFFLSCKDEKIDLNLNVSQY